MSITLAESLAMAVLKGDTAAAYALADQLIEEREGFENLKQRAIATRTYPYATDGYSVYSWPEFRAFCDRLGVLWDLRTIDITISSTADLSR